MNKMDHGFNDQPEDLDADQIHHELESELDVGQEPTFESKRFSLLSKILIAALLIIGIPTVAIAYTAPDLLEPFTSALTDSLLLPESQNIHC